MAIVIIETPYAGNTERHTEYLRMALRDSLFRGESPFASHGLYTLPGVLDDHNTIERRMGMDAGFEFYKVASLCAVYIDMGMSQGMREGIEHALAAGLTIDLRTVKLHSTPQKEREA